MASGTLPGTWSLTTQVESSSYQQYRGLQLGYLLQLQQNGNRITGSGRKVTENGKPLGAKGQTPISVEGTVEGDRLRLTFTERGARRASAGQFDLQVDSAGVIRGRFTSNAARSAGSVEGTRRK